jgi:HK97 family phage major capsid protein
MFVKKSKEELEGMDALELQAYYTEKFNHEKSELEARVADLEAEKGNDKYESLSEEVKALKESKIESLENALKMQGLVLDKIKSGQISGATVSAVEGSIEKSIEDNIENFKSHASGDSNSKFKFEVKVAGDMTLGGNVSGGTMPQPQRLEGVNDIAERVAITYAMIPKLTTDRNAIEWVYESAQDGTIDGTAEGTAKDQIDNDFVVTSVSLVKRAAYFKVSTEMLDDVSFMAGWLRNKLIIRLFLDVDNQCLNGDNTGQNLNGIINQATAFAAGTFANTVDSANDVDSLVVAINQIEIANQGTGNLQIQMHPSDVAALKLVKLSATDKRYIDRLVDVAGQLSLDGVPIVKNNNITAGDFLVGDFSKATIVQKGGIMVEVGLDGNDFTTNMRTILAEWRGQLFVQNNDTSAFVTGTFATTNAALETP